MKRLLVLALIPTGVATAFAGAPPGGGSPGQEDSGLPEIRDFDFWSYAVNMLIALFVVVGLIVLIAWFLRRTMGRRLSLGGGGILQLVASVPLGDRRFISVLRVGERYFLVGISSAEINMLSELDPEEVQRYAQGGGEAGGGGFSRLLQRLRGGRRESSE